MPTMQDVASARTNAQNITSQYSSMAAQAPRVADLVKQKVTEAFNYNKDIVEPLNQTTATYLAAPSTAREKYQDIFNPFSREKLVSQYTANTMLPMLSYSSILGQRQGSMADLVNAGTGAYQAQMGADQASAQGARQNYEDLMNEYKLQEDAKNKGSGAGGLGGLDIGAILAAILGGGQQTYTPTEPKPQPSMAQLQRMTSKSNVQWKSPGGQWMFDPETQDYYPIID